MLEPWNNSFIQPPPVHTYPRDNKIDITDLVDTCNDVVRVLNKQSPLHKESAVLSRFVYKYDKKFRNDIGYRSFKKVNTALRKYLSLNFVKDVQNYIAALPSKDDEYLPTRQMLEYVILRLLTFSKIMVRICVCSKQAAVFYLDRVKRGESHWMSLMPYALLSRVWSLVKVLLQYACSWYCQLLPFLDKFQKRGLEILPKDYTFPVDIKEWLDFKNLDNIGRYDWSQKSGVDVDSNLLIGEENDTFDSILQYVNQVNDDNENNCEELEQPLLSKLKCSEIIKVNTTQNTDHGEAISRESFKALMDTSLNSVKEYKNKKSTYYHTEKRVTNKCTLDEFLSKEETYRNDGDNKALTSHLSFMQWQALKKSLQQLGDSLSNNRKIERKFQKIWKEKCTDYS